MGIFITHPPEGGRVRIDASCQGQRSLNGGKDFDSGDAVPQ